MSEIVNKYNRLARLFHWVSALLIFGLFALGFWMIDLTYYSEWYNTAPFWHKSIGITLFGLTLLRLIWKIVSKTPAIDLTGRERKIAISMHHLLYLLLFIVFISGYMISTADGRAISVFNLFEIPGFGSFFENQASLAGLVHKYVAYTIVGLAVLHGIVAIKHHIVNKDNTLKKML